MKKFKDIQIGDKVYFYRIVPYTPEETTNNNGDYLTVYGTFDVDVMFDNNIQNDEEESTANCPSCHYIGLTVNPYPNDYIFTQMITTSLPMRFEGNEYKTPHSEIVDIILPEGQTHNTVDSCVYFNDSIGIPFVLFSDEDELFKAIMKIMDKAIEFQTARNISDDSILSKLQEMRNHFINEHHLS